MNQNNIDKDRLNRFLRKEKSAELTHTQKKLAQKIGVVALTATLLLSAHYLSTETAGGSDLPSGEIDTSIDTLYVETGARWRHDPYTDNTNADGSSTYIGEQDDSIMIEADNNIRVMEDKDNGEWYGVPVTALESVDPDFNPRGDKDGVIWVNTAKAHINGTIELDDKE